MFGGHTVTLLIRTATGGRDRLGVQQATETTMHAPGCHHRTLTGREVESFAAAPATAVWKTTIPVVAYDEPLRAAVLGLKPSDAIAVGGQELEVTQVRIHSDMDGSPYKVTVISKVDRG